MNSDLLKKKTKLNLCQLIADVFLDCILVNAVYLLLKHDWSMHVNN